MPKITTEKKGKHRKNKAKNYPEFIKKGTKLKSDLERQKRVSKSEGELSTLHEKK